MTQKEKDIIFDIYLDLAEKFQECAYYIENNIETDGMKTIDECVEGIKRIVESSFRKLDSKIKLNNLKETNGGNRVY